MTVKECRAARAEIRECLGMAGEEKSNEIQEVGTRVSRMVEERARIEITSCLAARSRLFERFNKGDVDGYCDYNGAAFFTHASCEF